MSKSKKKKSVKKKVKRFYQLGNIFVKNKEEYILCRTDYSFYALVSLKTGDHYRVSRCFPSSVTITDEQIEWITGKDSGFKFKRKSI